MKEKAFNRANYLTVKEFAGIVEKSLQSVYRRLERKENKTKYLRTFDGKKYIHKAAAWDLYGIDIGYTPPAEAEPDISDDTTLAVKILLEQVKAKDKQIEAKDRQIEELNEQIRRAQILHAETQNKLTATMQRLHALEDRQATRAQETGNAADQETPPATTTADQEPDKATGTTPDPKEPDPPTPAADPAEPTPAPAEDPEGQDQQTAPAGEPETVTQAAEPDQTPTAPTEAAEATQEPLQGTQATAAPSQEPLQGTQAADTHSQAVEPSRATDTPSQETIQATIYQSQEPEPQQTDKPSLWKRFLAFLGF